MLDFLLNLFTPEGFGQLFSGLIFVLLLFYALVSLIVIRSVHLMNKNFGTDASSLLNILAILHFIAALGLLIIAYIIL